MTASSINNESDLQQQLAEKDKLIESLRKQLLDSKNNTQLQNNDSLNAKSNGVDKLTASFNDATVVDNNEDTIMSGSGFRTRQPSMAEMSRKASAMFGGAVDGVEYKKVIQRLIISGDPQFLKIMSALDADKNSLETKTLAIEYLKMKNAELFPDIPKQNKSILKQQPRVIKEIDPQEIEQERLQAETKAKIEANLHANYNTTKVNRSVDSGVDMETGKARNFNFQAQHLPAAKHDLFKNKRDRPQSNNLLHSFPSTMKAKMQPNLAMPPSELGKEHPPPPLMTTPPKPTAPPQEQKQFDPIEFQRRLAAMNNPSFTVPFAANTSPQASFFQGSSITQGLNGFSNMPPQPSVNYGQQGFGFGSMFGQGANSPGFALPGLNNLQTSSSSFPQLMKNLDYSQIGSPYNGSNMGPYHQMNGMMPNMIGQSGSVSAPNQIDFTNFNINSLGNFKPNVLNSTQTMEHRKSFDSDDEDVGDDEDDDDDSKQPRRWTEEEDALLQNSVQRNGAKNWKKIAIEVPGRNHVQCLQRWKKALDPNVVKGHWSPQEDELLLRLMKENPKNWGHVARGIQGRTAKQCRERYHNHLDPSIKKGDWTIEEDMQILRRQKEIGNKWADIAKMLPGRTENSVKIRWKSIKRQVTALKAEMPATTSGSAEDDEQKRRKAKRSTMEHERLMQLLTVWESINVDQTA